MITIMHRRTEIISCITVVSIPSQCVIGQLSETHLVANRLAKLHKCGIGGFVNIHVCFLCQEPPGNTTTSINFSYTQNLCIPVSSMHTVIGQQGITTPTTSEECLLGHNICQNQHLKSSPRPQHHMWNKFQKTC